MEVLTSGLIPVVYKYPVFKTDIEKYKFNIVALDEFRVSTNSIDKLIRILNNEDKRVSIEESVNNDYFNKNI